MFGLKMIAATSALCAFLAAGLAAVGKDCVTTVPPFARTAQTVDTNCHMRSGALFGIVFLAVVSLGVWGLLEIIRRHINTPPELEELREMQKATAGNNARLGPDAVDVTLHAEEDLSV